MLTESGFFKEGGPSHAKSAARSSLPPGLTPGRRIASGKYELLRKIGVGAMGEVWAAKHLSLDEEVAIKLVLRGVAHEDGSTADGRFLVEARVARLLSRKTRHVVSVTDHGSDEDTAYLVMELLNGEPLDRRLTRSGPLALEKVVPVIKQVARALAVAHGEGIVHRDLKPGNVFLTLDEEGKALIKILDFGIAKVMSDPDDSDDARDSLRPPIGVSVHEAKQKTLRGFLLGTPAFMSPEQARGKKVDHRVDVWALSVITYHLLTGEYPFDGKDAEELFRRLVSVQAYPIADHRIDFPAAIGKLFEKAFAKRIEDRFASAEEFATALDVAAGRRKHVQLSLPPPAIAAPPVPAVKAPETAASKAGSSIIAAGVPRGDRRGVFAATALLFALALMGFGYRQFAHPEVRASGLSAGAQSVVDPSGATNLMRSGEPIPPPEPMEAVAPVKPPAKAEPVTFPNPSLPEAQPTGVPASEVSHPVVDPPPPSAPPPNAAKKPVNKSEVF
jgi:serine/threonine-protein kinase